MDPTTPWADPRSYFADPSEGWSESPGHRQMSARLRGLLRECVPEGESRVRQAVKDWNLQVREQLRVETALRLSAEDQSVTVPVRVTDGVPPPLWQRLNIPDTSLRLLLLRGTIAAAAQGVHLIRADLDAVRSLVASEVASGDDLPSEPELARVARLLSLLTEELADVRLFDDIWREPVDWLGAYFFRKPLVEIYWIPIAFEAARSQLEIEALTYVVLAHELAHAYTHLGRDIDGHSWRTEDFAGTSGYVVEGLAQHYARMLCRKVEPRFPAALRAFDAMLEHQRPGPYADFENWVSGVRHPGEHLRQSMLELRRKGLRKYAEFQRVLGGSTG